jgi:hypothetical protein
MRSISALWSIVGKKKKEKKKKNVEGRGARCFGRLGGL